MIARFKYSTDNRTPRQQELHFVPKEAEKYLSKGGTEDLTIDVNKTMTTNEDNEDQVASTQVQGVCQEDSQG